MLLINYIHFDTRNTEVIIETLKRNTHKEYKIIFKKIVAILQKLLP